MSLHKRYSPFLFFLPVSDGLCWWISRERFNSLSRNFEVTRRNRLLITSLYLLKQNMIGECVWRQLCPCRAGQEGNNRRETKSMLKAGALGFAQWHTLLKIRKSSFQNAVFPPFFFFIHTCNSLSFSILFHCFFSYMCNLLYNVHENFA